MADWLVRGRYVRAVTAASKSGDLTISELLLQYMRFAETNYVKNDQPTCRLRSVSAPNSASEPIRKSR